MDEQIDYSKPFPVRIVQDNRGPEDLGLSGKLDGKYGMCLGLYEFPHTWKETTDEINGNPLILTNSGDYIWGIDCWWDPHPEEHEKISLDLQQRVLELHKIVLKSQLGIETDPSLN